MALSRLQVRQLVGQDTAAERFVVGAVLASPAPAENSFALVDLIDNGAEPSLYKDKWLWHQAQAAERRIIAYDKAQGKVTVHRDWASTPTAGQTVEVHRFPPSLIHKAINDGLARCTTISLVFPALQSGNQIADLATAAPWVRDQKEIVGVYAYDDAAIAGGRPPTELTWSRRFEDGLLYLDPATFLSPGEKLGVEVYKTYDPLASDAATTDCPEMLVRSAALVELYTVLTRKGGPGKDNSRYAADLQAAKTRFTHFAKVHSKQRPKKLGSTTPVPWGNTYRRSW